MNISFYLRGRSIYIDIYHKDFRIQKPTGRKADKLDGMIVPKDRPTSNILATMKTALEDFEVSCVKSQTILTEKAMLRELELLKSGKEIIVNKNKPFFVYFEEWIEESKHRISEVTNKPLALGTIKRYKSAMNTLLKFEAEYKYPLTIHTINDNFYVKFRKFLLGDLKYKVNTFADNVKQIKTFCKWYQKKEPALTNDFRDFKKTFSYAEAEPLKEQELINLYNLKLSNHRLDKARLIHLFLCSTGLRISDYNQFNPDVNIKDGAIIIKTIKTNTVCYIPFYDDMYFRPQAILAELKEKFGTKTKISGQKLNDYIKEVAKEADIRRIVVTTRTGRKTFATLKLLSGVPAEVVMKSTGHKTRPAFDSYVGIDHNDIIKQNMDKAKYLKVV